MIFDEENIHDDFKKYFKSKENLKFEWTLERGYFSENASTPARAKRTFTIHLNQYMSKKDSENICHFKNFKIIPHLPNEIPTEFHTYRFYFGYYEMMTIEIQAKSLRLDESLRKIPKEKRNCYFEGERKLLFFKSYTKDLCSLECYANFTMNSCGCVKYYMPRNKTAKVCSFSQYECVLDAESTFNSGSELSQCACYQTCTNLKYSFEHFRSQIDDFTKKSQQNTNNQ